jgi:7-cyano-7-deazaguanine synthase in queuosine biosynthesis
VLAVAVAHIDRKVVRRIGEWHRNFVLRLPVKCPDKWSNPETSNALSDCLNRLTGDLWRFEFYQGLKPLFSIKAQTGLSFVNADAIIPYSGGLDSKATLAISKAKSDVCTPLAVTILHASKSKGQALSSDHDLPYYWIGADIKVGQGNHQETSYRARSFLFLIICSVVARALGVSRILVPETGQGSIGSVLVRWGHEHPQYGSHPLFTKYLREFLRRLFGSEIPEFEHPNIWLTKSELLEKFVHTFDIPSEAEQAILKRYSCSQGHMFRFKGSEVHKWHCGICPNCLFRRVALVNAGLGDFHEKEPYIWKRLSASSFDDMRILEAPGNILRTPSSERDQKVAKSGFILHRDFARLASKPLSSHEIRRQAKELAIGTGLAEDSCLFSLGQLIRRHADQWSVFVEEQIGQASWFQDLI